MVRQLNIMDIKDLEENFNSLQDHSDAQFKTIVQLQQKLFESESKNKHLLQMIQQNLPSLEFDNLNIVNGVSNERLICETQITFLKERAVLGQLTLEETKKFDIFIKALDLLNKNVKDKDDIDAKLLPINDLISIASSLENSNGSDTK